MMMVLFGCVGNSGRSQMAEAIFNSLAPGDNRAMSAGTMPARRVSRRAVEVMGEIGLNITRAKPKLLTQTMVEEADRIVTMGCLEERSCPAFLIKGKSKLEDWDIEDPRTLPLEQVRRIREQIKDKVRGLIEEIAGQEEQR